MTSHTDTPSQVRVFAPATVANLGPGFDALGMAVEGLGDIVRAERLDGPLGVELGDITGDGRRLPRDVEANTATVAAASVARRLKIRVRIHLEKGLPLSSGLGSSAASAVAGAVATAALGGVDLSRDRRGLLADTLVGEAVASGAAHADNVAPSLLGGAVLVYGPQTTPPGIVELPVPEALWIALALPQLELETRRARAALPERIPLWQAVLGWSRLAGVVAGLYRDDLALLAEAMHDDIVEPVRGALITGFADVQRAARESGALACSISGAGPTVFAITGSAADAERTGTAMVEAWGRAGVPARSHVARPDRRGARVLPPERP